MQKRFLYGKKEIIERQFAMNFIQTKLVVSDKKQTLVKLYNLYLLWLDLTIDPISITEFEELILFRYDFQQNSVYALNLVEDTMVDAV